VKVRTSSYTSTAADDDIPPHQHTHWTKQTENGATLRLIQDGTATTNTAQVVFTELLIQDETTGDTTSLIPVQGDDLDDGLFVAIGANDYDMDSSPFMFLDEEPIPPPDEYGVEEYDDEQQEEQDGASAAEQQPSSRRQEQRQLQTTEACADFFHVEVAIRYDSSFCADYGGSHANTLARIEDIVFMASAHYEVPGLCTTLRLAHTEGFCTGDSGADVLRTEIGNLSVTNLLKAFNTYQNGIPFSSVRRDVFHLFVGNDFAGGTSSSTRGLAYNGLWLNGAKINGVICRKSSMSAVNSLGGSLPLLIQVRTAQQN